MRRQGILLQHQEDRIERCSGLKRRPAGQHLVKNRSQAEDVAGRADPGSPDEDLLGCHVAWRTDDRARGSQVEIRVEPLGETEVGDVRAALAIDQDIRRLQVAMQHAQAVSVIHRTGNRRQQSGCLARRDGALAQPGASDWPSMSFMMKYGCPS